MTDFQIAVERVKTLSKRPNDEEMLKLYGLFKQATVGNVNTERPSFWNLVAKAKWDAWNEVQGIDSESAKDKYVAFVTLLVEKYDNA